MVDKFEKRTVCLYCGNEMEAKYRNKKFCSDKCRVYFSREKIIEKLLPKEFGEIRKLTSDMVELGMSIQKTTPDGKIKRINPLGREGHEVISKAREIPPMPLKIEGENSLDYAARKNEWKLKYNQ